MARSAYGFQFFLLAASIGTEAWAQPLPPASAEAARFAAEHGQAWGLLATLPGSAWQLMNSQIVSYRWDEPGRTMIEVDEATGEVFRWTLQPDGTIERLLPDGRRTANVVNPDGTITQYSADRSQRQTVRALGPVFMNVFEYLEDGRWTRHPPYDWFKWRMTDAEIRVARESLAAASDRGAVLDELLGRFRGSTVVQMAEARLAAHSEAIRRQQAGASEAVADSGSPPRVQSDGPRVALVVGIGAYGAMGDLPNPVNDARAMAAKLRQIGFDVVLMTDSDQRSLYDAIQDFGGRLGQAGRTGTGLFYFAGHGMQSRGENYLIPIGAAISREADLVGQAVSANAVLAQMEEAGSATNIIILDACRNLPMARSFRSGGAGLSQMDAPNGSFIAYSTAPGSVAADGAGAHSPFAAALIEEIARPGQPIEGVFRNVRRAVLETTDGAQTPWDSSSLVNVFQFVPS